ncbi:MAG: hypothetical protein AB1779_10575 [Candidatus Thermoplasmatota archaeon]
MKEFDVKIGKEINELAKVTEVLARYGVNIKAIATEPNLIRVVTNDEKSTKAALERAGMEYKETEIIVVNLIDRPGELAKVARKLVKAGVYVESVYLLGKDKGKAEIALTVDNLELGKKALK